MTRELLNQVAKSKGINLAHFDHVMATCNPTYTFVRIAFFCLEVFPGGQRKWCGTRYVKLSIASILKKVEQTNVWPEDYETRNGDAQWLYEIQ